MGSRLAQETFRVTKQFSAKATLEFEVLIKGSPPTGPNKDKEEVDTTKKLQAKDLGNIFENFVYIALKQQIEARGWGTVDLSGYRVAGALAKHPDDSQLNPLGYAAIKVAENLAEIWDKKIQKSKQTTITVKLNDPGLNSPIGDILVSLGNEKIVLELKWQSSPEAPIRWGTLNPKYYTALDIDNNAFKGWLKDHFEWQWDETESYWIPAVQWSFIKYMETKNKSAGNILEQLYHKGSLYQQGGVGLMEKSNWVDPLVEAGFVDPKTDKSSLVPNVTKVVVRGTKTTVTITDAESLLKEMLTNDLYLTYDDSLERYSIPPHIAIRTGPEPWDVVAYFYLQGMSTTTVDKKTYLKSPEDSTFSIGGRIASRFFSYKK